MEKIELDLFCNLTVREQPIELVNTNHNLIGFGSANEFRGRKYKDYYVLDFRPKLVMVPRYNTGTNYLYVVVVKKKDYDGYRL